MRRYDVIEDNTQYLVVDVDDTRHYGSHDSQYHNFNQGNYHNYEKMEMEKT